MECTDAQRVNYAVSMLYDDAYEWWKTIPSSLAEPFRLTWVDFLREFKQKYVPVAYVDAKLQEFLRLKSENRSMAEYEWEFTRLSYYAGGILTSNKERCKRFKQGLKPSIRRQVTGFQYEDFLALISNVLEQERIDNEEAMEREGKNSRARPRRL
ncbi:uncharacterized protein LOC131179404 [Hevea brasiliensis]|uniref:uncharacterized protein LOC131179404 n=1 Tax=Hevea brasiliensis TaxID=3981 RepID=UPI0025FBE02F|nr:uncharacterized protein LOC131179404 [Hevea brasiliensis]